MTVAVWFFADTKRNVTVSLTLAATEPRYVEVSPVLVVSGRCSGGGGDGKKGR